MHILHIVPSIQASTGGPAVSVTRLASEQAKLGHEVALACLDYAHLGEQMKAPGIRLVSVEADFLAVRWRGWSRKLRRVIREMAGGADIIHNHGLWMWPNAYAREAAMAAGKPLAISPRGMLESWSLNRSRLRKAVAWRLFEEKNLRTASLFHATAESEAVSIRRFRLTQPVVVSPNGVDLPDLRRNPGRALLEERFPRLRKKRWVVFMSRLHPKKGIDVLLRAWGGRERLKGEKTKRLKDEEVEGGGVLVLAGGDLIGYRKTVERMIEELKLGDSVMLAGELGGKMKDALLANASVFVLPSYSENFGLVVAEALAWGRPVIVSKGAPWAEVAGVGAGWWINPEVRELTEALRDVLQKSDEELSAMGQRGRALVEENYAWENSARFLLAAYEKVVSRS